MSPIIYNLEVEIEILKEKIEELTNINSTVNGEFKLQHFLQYHNDFQEWELEELLKNGRKYLKK